MDTTKFDYFLAKYRAADPDELIELGARINSLAEEAEAALRQVVEERSLVLHEPQGDLTDTGRKLTTVELEERSYSPARAEMIHIRKMRLLWSFPLVFVAGFIYSSFADSVRGTLMGPPVALIGLFAYLYSTYCVYKLSRAIDPKRSVAWGMVAVCLIPIIGWFALISLILKASRIRNAVNATAVHAEA